MQPKMEEVAAFDAMNLLASAQEYMVLHGGCRLTDWADLELHVSELVVDSNRTGVLALDPRSLNFLIGNRMNSALVRVPPIMLDSKEGIALVLDRWANYFSAGELTGMLALSYKLGKGGTLKPVLSKVPVNRLQAAFYQGMKPARFFQEHIELSPYVPNQLVANMALKFKLKTDKVAKRAFKGFASEFDPKLDMERWMEARLMEFEPTVAA